MSKIKWLSTAALLLASTGGVLAQGAESQNWIAFATQGAAGYQASADNQTYDASFAKQWEANPPKGFPTLAPENLAAMKVAIKHYTEIVDRGGWPMVPDVQMQIGSSGAPVAALRERLTLSGDLKPDAGGVFGSSFGADLEKAVKRFQASNGLTPTGIVDKRTNAALNVPAAARLKQLKANLTRLQELNATAKDKRYVVVNIPAAQIEAVENNQVVSRHAGVVGKIDRQTPILKSAIHELNFNPVWHLPPTVIEKDLIPKGAEMSRRGQDVLAKYGIEVIGADGKKLDSSRINWNVSARNLTFRQAPGPENPLGFVKINFHNAHSVYMHDSPSQTLFGRNFRAASSGCVRISGIEHLAGWLVTDQGWTREKVLEMKKSGERLDVKLKKPVPLYFAYVTAWATEDGVIQFRRDIYNKDGVGPQASAY